MRLSIEISNERAKELLEDGLAGLTEEAKDRIRGNGTRSREIIRMEIDKRLQA